MNKELIKRLQGVDQIVSGLVSDVQTPLNIELSQKNNIQIVNHEIDSDEVELISGKYSDFAMKLINL